DCCEVDDLGVSAIGSGDARTPVEQGAGIHPPAAIALRCANLEQAGFARSLNRFFNHTPIGFADRSVLAQQRLKLARPGDQFLNRWRRNAADLCDFIHDNTLLPRNALYAALIGLAGRLHAARRAAAANSPECPSFS